MIRDGTVGVALRMGLWLWVVVGAVVVVTTRGESELTVRVVATTIAFIGLAEGLRWLHLRVGAADEPLAPLIRSRTTPRPPPPATLDEWIGLVRSAGADRRAGAALRVRLRELALAHLAARGMHHARQPAAARTALGPAAWVLDGGDDLHGEVDEAAMAATLDRLEKM